MLLFFVSILQLLEPTCENTNFGDAIVLVDIDDMAKGRDNVDVDAAE